MIDSPALVTRGRGDAGIEHRTIAPRSDDDVLVVPELVGLCGTDLEIVAGVIDPAYIRYPVTLGHEWCGRVAERDGELGARVVAEGVIPCRVCRPCVVGQTNLCETYDEIGFTRDGAAAGAIFVPRTALHRIDDGVSARAACLVEPSAVVFRALTLIAMAPGQSVLIVGDGTIGLLAAYFASLWHPRRIDLLGGREEQQALAHRAGVSTFTTDPHAVAGGYDVVLEAAGRPAAVESALAAARRGGSVILLGLAGSGETAGLDVDQAVNNDLTIRGSFSYTSAAFRDVVGLINDGLVDPSFLVTHEFPFTRFDAALTHLRHSDGERGKIILNLSDVDAARPAGDPIASMAEAQPPDGREHRGDSRTSQGQ